MHYRTHIVRRFLAECNKDMCGTSRNACSTIIYLPNIVRSVTLLNSVLKNINSCLRRLYKDPEIQPMSIFYGLRRPSLRLQEQCSMLRQFYFILIIYYEHDNETPAVAQHWCYVLRAHSIRTWRFINIPLKYKKVYVKLSIVVFYKHSITIHLRLTVAH